jgi:hypothetical protein
VEKFFRPRLTPAMTPSADGGGYKNPQVVRLSDAVSGELLRQFDRQSWNLNEVELLRRVKIHGVAPAEIPTFTNGVAEKWRPLRKR